MERTFHMLLYRAFHAQRNFLRPSLGELGLGPGQPKLLNYLMNRGPCRQRELADYFEIDPAAVCRMLDCLQKSGFVTRRADGQSRRRDVVELTEAGRQINLDWQRRCRVMEEAMLSGFNSLIPFPPPALPEDSGRPGTGNRQTAAVLPG